jgi:hypothetical protein
MLVMAMKPAPLMHIAYQISRLNSGFRREVDENCALLCYYAASSGNSLPTFRGNLSTPSSKVRNLENGGVAEFFWIESALEWGFFWFSSFYLRLRLLGLLQLLIGGFLLLLLL